MWEVVFCLGNCRVRVRWRLSRLLRLPIRLRFLVRRFSLDKLLSSSHRRIEFRGGTAVPNMRRGAGSIPLTADVPSLVSSLEFHRDYRISGGTVVPNKRRGAGSIHSSYLTVTYV